MVTEFMGFWRVLPDTWQSTAIRRVSNQIMQLAEKDQKLLEKLDAAEEKGSIKDVEKYIKKAAAEEMKELAKVVKVGKQTQVLELHETQRLGDLNRLLAELGMKIGKEKVKHVVSAVNLLIKKLQNLETTQMQKFDKLKTDDEVWARAIQMDEGSIIQEMKSIGVVERRLLKKIIKVEKRASKIAEKIQKGKNAEKMQTDFLTLESMIHDLEPLVNNEIKYFDEEVKDEIIFVVFLKNKLKKLQGRIKKYVSEGFPAKTAERANKIVDKVFAVELKDLKGVVADYRYAISQTERQYAEAKAA